MRQAQRGDSDAYERCLVELAVVLRAYVRANAGDVPWADDVVQETLLSIHRARHTYDASRSFAAWFYAIARNRLIDGLRQVRRRDTREVAMERLPEPSATPATTVERGPLVAALAQLPPRQREVITAMKVHGDSTRDVAARAWASASWRAAERSCSASSAAIWRNMDATLVSPAFSACSAKPVYIFVYS